MVQLFPTAALFSPWNFYKEGEHIHQQSYHCLTLHSPQRFVFRVTWSRELPAGSYVILSSLLPRHCSQCLWRPIGFFFGRLLDLSLWSRGRWCYWPLNVLQAPQYKGRLPSMASKTVRALSGLLLPSHLVLLFTGWCLAASLLAIVPSSLWRCVHIFTLKHLSLELSYLVLVSAFMTLWNFCFFNQCTCLLVCAPHLRLIVSLHRNEVKIMIGIV